MHPQSRCLVAGSDVVVVLSPLCVMHRSRLATALLNLSSESVGSMLVEDEASAARRASLTARKDMLEQAMKVMRAAV